jgi:hypothetical protein
MDIFELTLQKYWEPMFDFFWWTVAQNVSIHLKKSQPDACVTFSNASFLKNYKIVWLEMFC